MAMFINLTPHTVTLMREDGSPVLAIPASGVIARAKSERIQVGSLPTEVAGYSVPICRTSYGEIENLPAPQPETYYIVSALTAQAVPEREDVLITDQAVRDAEGRIIGCMGLAHI